MENAIYVITVNTADSSYEATQSNLELVTEDRELAVKVMQHIIDEGNHDHYSMSVVMAKWVNAQCVSECETNIPLTGRKADVSMEYRIYNGYTKELLYKMVNEDEAKAKIDDLISNASFAFLEYRAIRNGVTIEYQFFTKESKQ